MDEIILSQGAEATIIQNGLYVVKDRLKKSYRHPILDEKLRKTRTKREQTILKKAQILGVRVPQVYDCTNIFAIKMDFIPGQRLKQVLLSNATSSFYLKELGSWLAILHEATIIHGDLTTSNAMVDEKGLLYLIDFGLSYNSTKIEDMAVDLHVLEQALESTHYAHKDVFFEQFLQGYAQYKQSDDVLERLDVLRLRGRNLKKQLKQQKEAQE